MKLFHEIYGSYYQSVAEILRAAPLDMRGMNRIVKENAYSESVLFLMPALLDEWTLLREEGTKYASKLRAAPPNRPMTLLERRWLKAQLRDPRVRLFLPDSFIEWLEGALVGETPLYAQEDFIYFDRYRDADPFSDERYICHFRVVLDALQRGLPLRVQYRNAKGGTFDCECMPLRIEFSGRDDKFRLYAVRREYPEQLMLLNLSRLRGVVLSHGAPFPTADFDALLEAGIACEAAMVRVTDENNALNRLLLGLADFDKQTRQEDGVHWLVRIAYSRDEEQELLIRLISFGSRAEVLAPDALRAQIAARLQRQLIPDEMP